jgi:hypothetical protein
MPGPFGLLVPALLALCALLLGLLPPALFSVLDIGRAGMSSASAVADAMAGALTASGFWSSAGPVLAVALAVVLYHVAGVSPWQRRVAALGRGVAGFEARLRAWPVAGSLLLVILLLQGAAALL